jgi:hypothetical protein
MLATIQTAGGGRTADLVFTKAVRRSIEHIIMLLDHRLKQFLGP